SNSGGALAGLGVKDGASRGVSKSGEATPDKAVKLELSTGAQLEVPKGAVDKATTVTIERPADNKAVDLVQRFKSDQDRIVSAPYVLKPHGTKFNEEVTVTLPLSKAGTRDEVEVAWLEDEDDTEWKKLGVAKSDGKSAQITLKHFSVLVVVEDASDLREVDEPNEPDAGGVTADAGGEDANTPGDGDAQAGTVEPDMDASTSTPADTGAGLDVQLDGATPGLEDAGDQLDGSPQLDGFVPIDTEASTGLPDSGTSLPDATVFVDASAPVLTSQMVAERLYDRLLQCGLVAVEGPYSIDRGVGSRQLCEIECLSRGTCEEAHSHYCPGIPVNDGGGHSPAVASCMSDCSAFTCPNGTAATRCNEAVECANGEDEQNCQGVFVCGTETIPYYLRCNMYVDCLDGSDEAGCFFCDGDARRLRPEQVCDDIVDCSDQTDVSTCASIAMCPLLPG
ncbi:MAG TPA: LDL receptor domain-containing protein, partial [Polyangiales bacterium]